MTVNFTGLILGIAMLIAIGVGFLWVIKLEYHIGAQIWPAVLAFGVVLALATLWIKPFWASALVGIAAGSIVWGATELPPQEERVRRGLFPANPKRRRKR